MFFALFLAIAAGACVAVAIVIAALVAWLARKAPLPVRILLFSTALIPLIGFVLFARFALSPDDPTSPTDLKAAYEREFGPMPQDVTDIRSRQVGVGDSVGVWLKFRGSRATANAIRKRFTKCEKSTFDRLSDNSESNPVWWQPDADRLSSHYHSPKWANAFSYSEAVFAHDEKMEIFYFKHEAAD